MKRSIVLSASFMGASLDCNAHRRPRRRLRGLRSCRNERAAQPFVKEDFMLHREELSPD